MGNDVRKYLPKAERVNLFFSCLPLPRNVGNTFFYKGISHFFENSPSFNPLALSAVSGIILQKQLAAYFEVS